MFKDKLMNLTRQLYPTGRAFKMPFNGVLERLHSGLADSENRAYADAISLLSAILPDNDSFTSEDATDWERRLGLITNLAVSLSDRKKAIIRKINHPGDIPARQSYRYMEGQLQMAGFNVYVHENRFPDGSGGYITKTPIQVVAETYGSLAQHGSGQNGDFQHGSGEAIASALLLEGVQHGDGQHGDFQHGFNYNNKIANHIDESLDLNFDTGNNLRSTFFVCGQTLGAFADVDADRRKEFRQLILKVKPAQTVGFLFINYI